MTQPTKDNHRVRMTGSRSASTRSHATEFERMRARRRKKRRSPVFPVICVVLLMVIIAGTALLLRPESQPPQEVYPIQYTAEVSAAAEEFDLEPAYLYAIILAESSFRPAAESSVGALGLMQIMPDTGKWLSGKFDMADTYTPDMLTDPAVNVRFGSWYLRFLLDRYDGDMTCATAAYHAGQGTVDRWLADPTYSPDGATLAFIEYDSTSNYVKKVLKYYEKYLALLSVPEDA